MKIYKITHITEEQLQNIDKTKGTVVEQKNIKGYDVALIKYHFELTAFPHRPGDPFIMAPNMYDLAIQKEGLDFTDKSQIMTKEKLSQEVPGVHAFLDELKSTLITWKQKYFPISIGSPNKRKETIYLSILRKLGFNLKPVSFQKETFYYLE